MSATLGLWMAAGAAQAQVPPGPDDVAPGEIVVTARKRQERLADVPGSVTAFGERERAALVLEDVDDYLRQVPGAALVTSGPAFLNDISLRGQGGGRLGFSETATGLFRDGLFSAGGGFGGRTLSRMDLFDLDRLEVLRGPQGALYGRNSVGGAINVISRRPQDEFGVEALMRAADPERLDVEAIVNAPVTDRLALRLGGFVHDQDGGYIENLDTGETLDRQRSAGARLSAELTPSERVTIGVRLEASESTAPSFSSLGYRATRIDGAPLDPSPYKRAALDRPGRSEIDETAVQGFATVDLGVADLTFRLSHGDRDGRRFDEDGDHFDGGTGIDVAPGAAVVPPDYAGDQVEDYRRTTAQLMAAAPAGSTVEWLFGAELLASRGDVMTGPADCPAYTGRAQSPTPGCIVGASGAFPPAAAASNAVRATGRLAMRTDSFREDLTSLSLFGAIELPVAPRLRLGAELRAQFDDKDLRFVRYSQDPLVYFGTGPVPAGLMAPIVVDPDGAGPLPPGPAQFCPPGLAAPLCAPGLEAVQIDTSRDWSFATPAATLRWTPADGHNAYLRFATAYRPGGFNSNLPSGAARSDLGATLVYEPEYSYSWEAGWKGSLLGDRLRGEVAAYYQLTTDVQVATAAVAAARGFLLVNAGDAYVYGLEAALGSDRRIGAGRVAARLSLATQAGRFRDGASAPANGMIVDISGNEVPRLRDIQLAFDLNYTRPLGRGVELLWGGSFQLAEGGEQNPFGTLDYDGYTLLDTRIGVRVGRWRIALFARNLTDERYLLNEIAGNGFWSEGRSWGLEVTFRS